MTTLDLPASRHATPRAQLAAWTRILCVLFFCSGFPALIYQLTWQRALFRIFGVNIESVTIVVTAFMLGLGIGSLAGGWLSNRRRIALLPLLAVIEAATGAFGLVSLAIFDRVGDLALGLSLPLTAIVTLALVIVPTYNDYLIFEGISVDEQGKQYYLDVHIAYRQACLNAIEYLTKFGYTRAQAYAILGTAPCQGHISGVVDIPNACATLWLPTDIFDFDVMPCAAGPTKHAMSAVEMPISPDK